MIGELNQRASILARTMTPDGGGGFSESWNAIATVWAKLETSSGADVFGPDTTEQRNRTRVTIRQRGDVAAGQRVTIGSRTLRIHNVLDDGGAVIALLCEELP
jgi:SPP1 family predicted phage head-tail adaptor